MKRKFDTIRSWIKVKEVEKFPDLMEYLFAKIIQNLIKNDKKLIAENIEHRDEEWNHKNSVECDCLVWERYNNNVKKVVTRYLFEIKSSLGCNWIPRETKWKRSTEEQLERIKYNLNKTLWCDTTKLKTYMVRIINKSLPDDKWSSQKKTPEALIRLWTDWLEKLDSDHWITLSHQEVIERAKDNNHRNNHFTKVICQDRVSVLERNMPKKRRKW